MAKGGATSGDRAEGAKSRRKGRAEAPELPPPRRLPERRQIITAAVAIALIIVGYVVTQTDGGAPQQGFATSQMNVTSWRYTAETDAGRETLCTSDSAPCDPDELWRHHTDNATCHMRATTWLAGGGMPLMLRNVQVRLNATAVSGDLTVSNDTERPVNYTTTVVERDIPWDNGWWWRVESEHVAVRIEAPCDTHSVSIFLDLSGTGMDGDPWSDRQSATVYTHQAYLAKLGRSPAAPI